MHHNLTDGYVTIEREDASAQDLFDIVHDLVDRLDRLEEAFAYLALISLEHLELIGGPTDPAVYAETLNGLRFWLRAYREGQERIAADQHFMDSPE